MATTAPSSAVKPRKPVTYKVTKPTAAALRLVRPYLVDRAVRWSQHNGSCEDVVEALTHIFGAAPRDGWRDSEGYDCFGFDVNGYDRDKRDEDGHDVEGYSEGGWDRDGYNRDNVDPWGRLRGSVEALVAQWPPNYRKEVAAALRSIHLVEE
jgi:hypothetical protein